MCRIFYNPSDNTWFEEEDLISFFEALEKSGGKDGNGVYQFSRGLLTKTMDMIPRGLDITESFLFHTRNGTHGLKKLKNVQPFVSERYVVVHNGICSGLKPHAVLIGMYDDTFSDTYMIFRLINHYGIINFYNAFINNSYGVILVYDKETELM